MRRNPLQYVTVTVTSWLCVAVAFRPPLNFSQYFKDSFNWAKVADFKQLKNYASYKYQCLNFMYSEFDETEGRTTLEQLCLRQLLEQLNSGFPNQQRLLVNNSKWLGLRKSALAPRPEDKPADAQHCTWYFFLALFRMIHSIFARACCILVYGNVIWNRRRTKPSAESNCGVTSTLETHKKFSARETLLLQW